MTISTCTNKERNISGSNTVRGISGKILLNFHFCHMKRKINQSFKEGMIGHINEQVIDVIHTDFFKHFCPIIGKVWVGVMPDEHSALIGLSKYARLVEWVMTRPQIQEEAMDQLAELLQEKMQPDGLAIVMEADHHCMQWRGVKDMNSKMTNSIMRGSFLKDPNLRREFLALLASQRG